MIKKTIFSLTLSLLLFASNGSAMDDAAAYADPSSGRMPNLGAGLSSGSDDDDHAEERRAGRDAKERKHQDKDDAQPSSASASRSRDVDAHERGFDTLYRKLGKSLLCPGVDPRDMLHASNMLYAKYAGYVKRGFRQLDAATLDPDFFAFLRTNGKVLESVCDADMMRIFLGFMGQLNTQGLLTQHAMSSIRFQAVVPDGGQVLLASMARTKHGQLVIDVDGGLKLLRGAIMPMFGPMMGAPMHMMGGGGYGAPMMGGGGRPVDSLDGVLKQLRKIVTADGRQLYSIEDDQAALSEVVSQWFNMTRKLYEHELGLWKKEGPRVELLVRNCEAAMAKLSAANDVPYSAVNLDTTTVALAATQKAEKAEDRAFLRTQIEKHMQSHQPQIDAYQSVKPILPTLKAGLKWFDEVFDYVKKNGRIT